MQLRSSPESLCVRTEWNRIRFQYLSHLTVFFIVIETNAIDIDVIAIAELDSMFTVVCLELFFDSCTTIHVRLCIYLPSYGNENVRVSFPCVCDVFGRLPVTSTASSGDVGKGDEAPELGSRRMKMPGLGQYISVLGGSISITRVNMLSVNDGVTPRFCCSYQPVW